MYCFVVVFFLQFKQLQRVVVTMALKSLYRVCEILKLDLIFSSFSVRSQNHSYKNSIVFRLARHLCSSTSLVFRAIYWRASEASETVLGVDNAKSGICYWRASVASETLTGVTQLKIGDVSLFVCIYVWTYVRHFCTLTLAFLC